MFFLGFLYITFFNFILYIFIIIITFSFFTVFFTCNSAFEQGHLEPWRYINAVIIIIIIIQVYAGFSIVEGDDLCDL